MTATTIFSINLNKETNKPYEILIDPEDLEVVNTLEIVVHGQAGSRNYISVLYRKYIGSKVSYSALSRKITGIEHTNPKKVIIQFKNDNHLDLQKKNLKLMSPGDYRTLVLEKKHGKSLTPQYSKPK
jgi:hypothetical protein